MTGQDPDRSPGLGLRKDHVVTPDREATEAMTLARGMADSRGSLAAIRTGSFASLVILVVQYALGVAESLYGSTPSADHSIGLFSGGTLLAVHGVLGILLALGGIGTTVRSVRTRHRPLAMSSALAMLALIAATMMGFTFLDNGQDVASLGMALATGVAMICYGFNVWVLGHVRETGRP